MIRTTVSALVAGLCLLTSVASRAETTNEAATSTHTSTKTTKTRKHVSEEDKTTKKEPVAADNTGTNKRDRADTEATADNQKNDKSDLELVAEIRRAIVKDKTLSTNAHNVKIIVQGGDVTLKGPVASKAEKMTVEKKAVDAAGRHKVVNELAVAP